MEEVQFEDGEFGQRGLTANESVEKGKAENVQRM